MPIDADGQRAVQEDALEPDLPIIDAHHHLWYISRSQLAAIEASSTIVSKAYQPSRAGAWRYLLDELLADAKTGHNVRATVFVDAHAMYKIDGPKELRSLGEVEFAAGVGAMADSRVFGDVRACAAIVGNVDLRLGEAAMPVLERHLQAAGGRYRGVRSAETMAHDPDRSILGGSGVAHVLLDERFRVGLRCLQRLGLSLDVWLLEPQLPDLLDLARAFPDVPMILNHAGGPVGVASYRLAERFGPWSRSIRSLATCSNVTVKLGGLALPTLGLEVCESATPVDSAQLAHAWKPYLETCIEAFGAERCMFESNFPVDSRVCSYSVLWNAFKRATSGASLGERAALFAGTAARVYRISL